MAATASSFVRRALAQVGDRYVFGAVARDGDPDPDVWDCSELPRWLCARMGVEPRLPDGSWNQYAHAHRAGLVLAPARALLVPGALLFRFAGGDPLAGKRPERAHVEISLGAGSCVGARSPRAGVVRDDEAWRREWTHAGLIPGLTYDPAPWSAGMPELERGRSGPEVRLLQHLLGPEAGPEDGIFGARTEVALRARAPGRETCDAALWAVLLAAEGRPGAS